MHTPAHREAAELLLAAMSAQQGDDGHRASFFFGKPGAPHWDRRMGVNVYYDFKRLTHAALYVRREGPEYLKDLSMDEIRSKLQNFVVENYWYLANDALFQVFDGSYADRIPPAHKISFAEALAGSHIFKPVDELTLFPLSCIRIEADFQSGPFFLVAASSLNATMFPSPVTEIVPEQFPPLAGSKGRKEIPSAWLAVRSPTFKTSSKMKAAILGALALTPLPRYRHRFSGREVIRGRCTFGSTGATTSYEELITPPLMNDIVVTDQDFGWLAKLADMLISNDLTIRRQLSALEYFYRAWGLDAPQRFPVLCMAIDALLSKPGRATASVIAGVRETIGPHVDEHRLRSLMRIRGDVIHGRAPDVYDSEEYAPYYDLYGEDPIRDMELVVGSCLRRIVFDGHLREHADPNAATIASLQASGRLPKILSGKSILDNAEVFDPRPDGGS